MSLRQWLLAPTVPRHSGAGRAARWARVWTFLAEHEEIIEVFENSPQERISENVPEQMVDMPFPQVDLAVSSGEAGSPWSRVIDTASAATTAVAKSVGEAQPPGIVGGALLILFSSSWRSSFAFFLRGVSIFLSSGEVDSLLDRTSAHPSHLSNASSDTVRMFGLSLLT